MLPARQFIHEVHASLGFGSLNEFRRGFQKLHQDSPIRAIRLFLFYAATRDRDPFSEAMAYWATSGMLYISILLDDEPANCDSLSMDTASKSIAVMGQYDPQFFCKFAHGTAALSQPEAILRALQIAPAIGDYAILIPWLRNLEKNSDSRVRAHAAKLLCQLRPNKGNIERHLQSHDSRVRASVLEALWQSKIIRTEADVFHFFRFALNDSNHRVVANALVGLYGLGEYEAIHKMISFSSNNQLLFRAAMAWAMGVVEDPRAIPMLETLQSDRAYLVRERARQSLSHLEEKPRQNGNANALVRMSS